MSSVCLIVVVVLACACATLPGLPASAEKNEAAPAGPQPFRLYDGFDGSLELDWETVRPDPTHVSLTKNPGKLTITTQSGGIYGGVGPSARNFHLIRNPVPDGGDFVLTTCIESFQPTTEWQQAGLLVYDDDDNYLKCDVEWNDTAVQLHFIRETEGTPVNEIDRFELGQERLWIRLIKRGRTYERAYSTDGQEFVSAGAKDWGNGAPGRIGIIAKNGPTDAAEIDAAFDFFEARSLTDAEKNDPSHLERQKLQGIWKVVSCELSGKPLEAAPISRFVFEGSSVTIEEKTEAVRAEFVVDPAKVAGKIQFSALFSQARRVTNGIYSLEDGKLVICLALQRNAPAPTEFETKAGDSRLLIMLRRTSERDAPMRRKPS